MSGYYGASIRGAKRIVRIVPRAWPAPLRLALQAVLVVVGIAFVLCSWAFTTAVLIVSNAGNAMGRGSNNIPPY
jgi:hypothetical protein